MWASIIFGLIFGGFGAYGLYVYFRPSRVRPGFFIGWAGSVLFVAGALSFATGVGQALGNGTTGY